MPKKANTILELIGDTPIVRFNRITEANDAEIWGKLENFNPMSSVKDRICLAMIEAAERDGKISEGATIIEPTSGNTGIGLAMVCVVKGYKLILTMPDTMSVERRRLLKAFGAEVVLTPGAEGMSGAVKKAEELLAAAPNSFMPQQFNNYANPEIHRKTTALEILEQTGGDLDAFVSGIGTGGTITGVGDVLKSKLPEVKIIAVEPEKSPVLSGGPPAPHRIQGIGAGFIPRVLNTKIYDEIIKVKDEDAAQTARLIAKKEGLFLGISSGAAAYAALQVARTLGKGKKVVVLLPDTGERYLSTGLFDES